MWSRYVEVLHLWSSYLFASRASKTMRALAGSAFVLEE